MIAKLDLLLPNFEVNDVEWELFWGDRCIYTPKQKLDRYTLAKCSTLQNLHCKKKTD